MQHIANSTQMEIIGIHNATNGITADAKESAADKLNIGNNGAYKTLVKTLFAHLENNPEQPIYLIAHSQGGIITSRAIRKVRSKLMASGLAKEEVIKKMKSIKIQTAGAAAIRYPKGPQYLHLVNTEDPIPNLTAGAHIKFLNNFKRGKVIQFNATEKAHSMNATYSRQLRNFTDLNWNY